MHTTAQLVISALSGGSGKTLVSLGLARAFAEQKLKVKTFKKGPDYIDTAWLGLASGTRPGNLDPFFSSPQQLRNLYTKGLGTTTDITIIEGNRGIFDGLDIDGSCSTAYLANLFQAPVVLVLDCTKMTRTAAAIVHGCCSFDPSLNLGGVILNKVGTVRQENLIRQSIKKFTNVPVLGSLPRKKEPCITEQQMKLRSVLDYATASALLKKLSQFIAAHIDLDAILHLSRLYPIKTPPPAVAVSPSSPLFCPVPSARPSKFFSPAVYNAGKAILAPHTFLQQPSVSSFYKKKVQRPSIGYIYDASLWFYYQENLDALSNAGARLTPLSLLSLSQKWPHIDGLYLGGGTPERYASQLSTNKKRLDTLYAMAHDGLPIYAECGGLSIFTKSITYKGKTYPMAGVFPYSTDISASPKGLGYVEALVVKKNPYHPVGATLRGHEFHYSYCMSSVAESIFLLKKGVGTGMGENGFPADGMLCNNTFACYTHLFAPSVEHWAPNFVSLCI